MCVLNLLRIEREPSFAKVIIINALLQTLLLLMKVSGTLIVNVPVALTIPAHILYSVVGISQYL